MLIEWTVVEKILCKRYKYTEKEMVNALSGLQTPKWGIHLEDRVCYANTKKGANRILKHIYPTFPCYLTLQRWQAWHNHTYVPHWCLNWHIWRMWFKARDEAVNTEQHHLRALRMGHDRALYFPIQQRRRAIPPYDLWSAPGSYAATWKCRKLEHT